MGRPQLVAIADAPTAHLCGPADDLLFTDLPDEARGRVLPLARLDARELGLDVPWVPVVYHETWHLETVEIVPVGDRFALAPALWWEITTPGVREHLARLGHLAVVPLPPGGDVQARIAPATVAYGHALAPATLRTLRTHGVEPVIGHAGIPTAASLRGDPLLQIDAGKLGLADVSFLIYWEPEPRRFVQVLQMP